MSGKHKHWQARIFTGEKVDQPAFVYGESLAELRTAAAAWLRENKPLEFGNASPGYELSRRVNYSYSDGTRKPVFPISSFLRGETLEEGWYYVEGDKPYSSPERLADFDEVIEHFTRNALIPEKGPDYKEIPLVEGNLPLHLIKTVRREENELRVNDFLQRGWYIISLEFEGEGDYRDQLVNRKTVFILGHPEERAS